MRQLNLRLPFYVVKADSQIHVCLIGISGDGISVYKRLAEGDSWYYTVQEYLAFCLSDDKGSAYLSEPDEVLIEMYDKEGTPRGIFPRRCFYEQEFQRYSVWGFVFNRHGQLLLHQRSDQARDNPGLWDKSIGGHVELRESSTALTAERELIEEVFLAHAEYTKYVREDLRYIKSLGDWTRPTNPVELEDLNRAYRHLSKTHWLYYRPLVAQKPMTVMRTSVRSLRDSKGRIVRKRARFISDVYFFVAPAGIIDNEKQVRALMKHVGRNGAAKDRKLLSVEELHEWCEREGPEGKKFTDDLTWMMAQHRELLEGFASFATAVF